MLHFRSVALPPCAFRSQFELTREPTVAEIVEEEDQQALPEACEIGAQPSGSVERPDPVSQLAQLLAWDGDLTNAIASG